MPSIPDALLAHNACTARTTSLVLTCMSSEYVVSQRLLQKNTTKHYVILLIHYIDGIIVSKKTNRPVAYGTDMNMRVYVKGNILAISSDTHQFHYILLHHFTIYYFLYYNHNKQNYMT